MQSETRSILEELESMHREKDSQHVIESRARNIIAGAINLLDLIEETYNEREAEDLTRKLLNSIKSRNHMKFKRSLHRVNESYRNNK